MLAEIGLVLLLFTDASRTDLKVLRDIRALPARLLSIGMLFTIVLGALAAKLVFPQLSLWEAGILSAILAPTDAGLGQVIVNSPLVPLRVREALNVEAGLNDGLSVPFMLFFIAMAAAGAGEPSFARFLGEQLGLGLLVGAGIGLDRRLASRDREALRLDGGVLPPARGGGAAGVLHASSPSTSEPACSSPPSPPDFSCRCVSRTPASTVWSLPRNGGRSSIYRCFSCSA